MENIKLRGAVLMIGSLFWETEESAVNKPLGKLREEWRGMYLDMSKAVKINVPIRYGRRSSQRRFTYTMMFSHSVPKDGEAYLVPFKQDIETKEDFSELYGQAIKLSEMEGISDKKTKTLHKNWGLVALSLTPHFKDKHPGIVKDIEKYWADIYKNKIDKGHYRIFPEPAVITSSGFLDIELKIPGGLSVDYIFSTPVVTTEARYPESTQVAQAMMQEKANYFTYFLENVKSGIKTFQDHEIINMIPPDFRISSNLGFVQLNDYNPYFGAADQFQRDIQFKMGLNLFAESKGELCKHAIHCMGIQTDKDIEEKEITESVAGLLKEFQKKFGRWDNPVEHVSYAEIDFFMYYFLNLSRLPIVEYNRILSLIEKDIDKRDKMIAYYGSMESVKKYLKSGKSSRGAGLKDNMEIDFYERNEQDKEQILAYKNNGLRQRVLFKSAGNYFVNSQHDGPFEWYFDRPYITSYPNSEKYFDNKIIDKVGHRLALLPQTVSAQEAGHFYATDKAKFYSLIFETVDPGEIMRQTEYWITFLPSVIDKRKEIFQELKILFEQKLWHAYFALSLTQLEGLYTDLLEFAKPTVKVYQFTLPRKVKEVRPEYEADFVFYDYCQYEVALKRNSFLHRGLTNEPELNSFDLLLDLWYLVQIFATHNSPVMEVNRIIERKDLNDFLSEEGFNHYFNLLESLTPEQTNVLTSKISDFEKTYLTGYLDLEYLSFEMADEIPKTINHWYDSIEFYIGVNEDFLNFRKMNITEIDANKHKLRKYCKAFFDNHKEIFEKIFGYQTFLIRYKKHIPDIAAVTDSVFSGILRNFQNEFDKISNVAGILQKN